MTPPVPSEVRGQIFALKGQNKLAYVVRKELLALKIDVSERSICRLWKKKLFGILSFEGTKPWEKRRRTKAVRTPEVIKKVKRLTDMDNPMTQEIMGKRVGVSREIIGKIIAEDLALKRLKKPTAKFLTDAKKLAKPFKNKIRKMLDYMLTLD